MISENLKKARVLFYEKKFQEALQLFLKEDALYEMGLCSLLLKDLKNAKKYWEKSKKSDPMANFGLCVLDFIDLKTKKIPTFFQTRAQLEIYLNLFLENNLIEWAQNLISCSDRFFEANPESYKFIARALFANGYFNLSITFCKKSLDIFYLDPEAMLILAQCYFLLGDLDDALNVVNKINSFIDDYYPARLFLGIVKDRIEKKI